jgi:hypothetical protein
VQPFDRAICSSSMYKRCGDSEVGKQQGLLGTCAEAAAGSKRDKVRNMAPVCFGTLLPIHDGHGFFDQETRAGGGRCH